MNELDRPDVAQPELPREIQRQLARHFEREQLKLKPLASSHNGHMLTAHNGAQYVRVNGGLRRVAIAEDGVHVIAKWSKARRRAEKRKRTSGRHRQDVQI